MWKLGMQLESLTLDLFQFFLKPRWILIEFILYKKVDLCYENVYMKYMFNNPELDQ